MCKDETGRYLSLVLKAAPAFSKKIFNNSSATIFPLINWGSAKASLGGVFIDNLQSALNTKNASRLNLFPI